MKKNKAFTLIELLVVLAIIGLLVAIVLVSMGTVRNKGKDAAVKRLMGQIRSVGEVYYASQTPNTYVGFDTSTELGYIETDVFKNNGGVAFTHFLNITAYCFQSPILGGGSWCSDSTGYRGIIANCEGTNFDCAP